MAKKFVVLYLAYLAIVIHGCKEPNGIRGGWWTPTAIGYQEIFFDDSLGISIIEGDGLSSFTYEFSMTERLLIVYRQQYTDMYHVLSFSKDSIVLYIDDKNQNVKDTLWLNRIPEHHVSKVINDFDSLYLEYSKRRNKYLYFENED